MKESSPTNLGGVIVIGGTGCNGLGIVRAFGKRRIPVVLLDSDDHDIIRYSKYAKTRIKCKSPEFENDFVKILLDFGKKIDKKMMIIPASDSEVIILSKHKHELEKYYCIPVPAYNIVEKLVNKKKFYKLLAEVDFPHPKTYFPENLTELREIGLKISYPFIIKPAYSLVFHREFGSKNFVVRSHKEFLLAIDKLRGKSLDVMIQEIIPGNEIYMFYTYFNRKSEPIAVCGYDKIRQFPDDFGSGSFCKSNWRISPVKECIRLLQTIKYQGFAEPELKRDPRDGKYKLIEINARTTTQNRLSAACGVDMEYLAYLDVTGQLVKNQFKFLKNICWIDDLKDLLSLWSRLRLKQSSVREIIKTLGTRKVHSIFSWDDPVPFFIYAIKTCIRILSRN